MTILNVQDGLLVSAPDATELAAELDTLARP